MQTVLIGGDICPIGVNSDFFRRGDAESLFHDLLPLFRSAALVIANLECPLIREETPIVKTGPVFGADTACINGVREAGVGLLCLANNHILDNGPTGLESTMRACADAGIATVGAGSDLAAAGKAFVTRAGNLRIGVLAMAEHEFSIATKDSPGAYPLDLIGYVRSVSELRTAIDYLVVLLHGGREFLTVPSPRLRDTCRFLVEMGANAVVVQHPHSFGGYETYRGGHIVYGQGALVMDEPIYRQRKQFHQGVLVQLRVADDASSSMALIPFTQSDPTPGARLMDEGRAQEFLHELAQKAEAILDDDFIQAEWRRFCEDWKHDYLSDVLGHNRLLRAANRTGRLAGLLYRGRRLVRARNLLCCETHREIAESILDGMVRTGELQ